MTDQEILQANPPRMPHAQLLWTALVDVGPTEDHGSSPLGHRFLVPILGGRFYGSKQDPALRGAILPGGADRQLLRPDGVKELTAIYEMKTDSGQIIGIENRVIVDTQSTPDRYAMSVITAHVQSGPLDWLNRRLLIGTLDSLRPDTPKVIIRAWLAEVTGTAA